MRFTAPVQELQRKVEIGAKMLQKFYVSVAYSCLKFQVKDTTLEIHSFDSDTANYLIQYLYNIEADGETEFLLNAQKLKNILKSVKADYVDFIIPDDIIKDREIFKAQKKWHGDFFNIQIKANRSKFKVKAQNVLDLTEFDTNLDDVIPYSPEIDKKFDKLEEFCKMEIYQTDIPSETFKKGTAATKEFVYDDSDYKPHLSGICLDFQKETNELVFVATNGQRLSTYKVHQENEINQNYQAIVPVSTLELMNEINTLSHDIRIIKKRTGGFVMGYRTDFQIITSSKEYILFANMTDEKYPPYLSVFPNEESLVCKFEISKRQMLDSLNQFNIFRENKTGCNYYIAGGGKQAKFYGINTDSNEEVNTQADISEIVNSFIIWVSVPNTLIALRSFPVTVNTPIIIELYGGEIINPDSSKGCIYCPKTMLIKCLEVTELSGFIVCFKGDLGILDKTFNQLFGNNADT